MKTKSDIAVIVTPKTTVYSKAELATASVHSRNQEIASIIRQMLALLNELSLMQNS